MGSAPPAPLPLARLAAVGGIVFLANAALLVLQLVAGRLLAPFIGSDLYTWTAVIGVFLTGIALGNAYGGRLADRYPSPRTVAALLAAGAVAALWMAAFPMLLTADASHAYRSVPLGPRIPLLAAVLCLPAGFVLSLLTPVAIKLGLPDVSKTGRVAGLVFALSTLGCLLGNYVTGFYLIPAFTINTLVYVAAGTLLALAAVSVVAARKQPHPPTPPRSGEGAQTRAAGRFLSPSLSGKGAGVRFFKPPLPNPSPKGEGLNPGGGFGSGTPHAFADIRLAFLVVFVASFGGMTLELAATRIIARTLGVSLYTWTGVIGVMLAGTAAGNLIGGFLADRANRSGRGRDPRAVLAGTLLATAGLTILVLVGNSLATRYRPFAGYELVAQIVLSTLALFFAPMAGFGMVSPQVIRLAVPDVARAGRVAGRVYAWSTAGAIAGTFAAGYLLLSALGVDRTVIAVTAALGLVALAVTRVWDNNLLLYGFSVVMGGATGGVILTWNPVPDDGTTVAVVDTNYYRIVVTRDGRPHVLDLRLDSLLHSTVDTEDPTFIHYTHEHVQMEFVRAARAAAADPTLLVIGGGGYTLPRFVRETVPGVRVDVVEIDPGVTKVAYEVLGLKKEYALGDYNMDGRQFVTERAAPHGYDLVVQDAVNDLSVPSHLLTKEYNDAVKGALKPDGVYLLTVIDSVEYGKVWRAAMATLRQTFPHVELLAPASERHPVPPPGAPPGVVDAWAGARVVYVIYASDRPFDRETLRAAATKGVGEDVPFYTTLVPADLLRPYLARDPGVVLTDQYAPVDNLMAEVFRRRQKD